MSKLLRNTKRKIGQSPGSLIYTGDKKTNGSDLHLIRYNHKNLSERVFSAKDTAIGEMISGYRKNDEVLWINIDGIQNTETVDITGKTFSINALTLEDILNTSHRPKFEDNLSYLFIVLKLITYDSPKSLIKVEQVSFILKENIVLTFQEDKIDDFDGIRENIRKNKGRVRELKADYLCYRLIDSVIDNYFSVLEYIGDDIEKLEDELLSAPTQATLQKLYTIKNQMLIMRRAIWPLREVINSMEKSESDLIHQSTLPFLRDLYDHIVQIIDTTENYREMISGMIDIYLSSVSNRLNEVMKVLTIISTIFIPLNFIAGVYGMNFNTAISKFNMPELNQPFGYLAVLSVMLVTALLLVYYFKRKKWF